MASLQPQQSPVHGEGQIERSSDEHLRNMLGFHAWAHLTSAAGPEDFFSLTPSQALPVNTESLMLPLQNAVISGHRKASRKLPLSLCDGPSGVVVEMDFGDDSGVASNPTGLELAVALPGEESINPRPESSASNASSCPHTRPVIFRVVSGTVGHKKLARTDSALELSGNHIAVERCAVHELDFPGRKVSVHVSQGDCQSQLLQRPASFAWHGEFFAPRQHLEV